jgi:hypothetical protein
MCLSFVAAKGLMNDRQGGVGNHITYLVHFYQVLVLLT